MKKFSLNFTTLAFSLIVILMACSAPAAPINVNADGVALKGYDPVAYFTLNRPVRGQKEFQHEWNNAKYLFFSREHLLLFQENPDKYAPQYGGY